MRAIANSIARCYRARGPLAPFSETSLHRGFRLRCWLCRRRSGRCRELEACKILLRAGGSIRQGVEDQRWGRQSARGEPSSTTARAGPEVARRTRTQEQLAGTAHPPDRTRTRDRSRAGPPAAAGGEAADPQRAGRRRQDPPGPAHRGDLTDDFADGVYFVSLAPIKDPMLVVPTIIRTLGIKEAGGRPLLELLKAYLSDKQLLLLLDNFEHVA